MTDIRTIGGTGEQQISESVQQRTKSGGASFADAISAALKDAQSVQNEAEKAIQDFAAGEVKDIHTVVVAMEKADMSLQTLLQVRNKLLTAYEEISKMQV
ncbi:MAG TPA: flagellar hook-basal body complex protein FliE [Dissulfurispiraceae bacterium]|nr:flagellar hook-basal body complex protein FliE [Dissulfurispiraceae bacterium]